MSTNSFISPSGRQADLKEILGFMVKKYYFYHKKITNIFARTQTNFLILKVTQTSSLSILYDTIYKKNGINYEPHFIEKIVV